MLSWLLLYKLTKEENLSKSLKEILSKLHHYHTESDVAQHEFITLTTYITNLSLTDSWKDNTCQFLSHLRKKLDLLDSLIPGTDKILSDSLPHNDKMLFRV